MITLIKSDAQYREVLDRVSRLAEADPHSDSLEGQELGVLALLLQDYERRTFPLPARSPLAALRTRMDQLELAPKDLVPYLGSRSKVSEVLAGKRPFSIAMIRSLHSGLGIPLESLISEEPEEEDRIETIEWDRFPIREMIRRKWVHAQLPSSKRISFEQSYEIMKEFLAPVGGVDMVGAVLHKTDMVRTARSSDRYALAAWSAYVLRQAETMTPHEEFRNSDWSSGRLRELRTLSRFEVGPRLALQYLAERGVIVVVVPHLPRTRLDGGAMLRADGTPVIGLTLRHDRVDNFWFTLFHELMHVVHHLKSNKAHTIGYSKYLDDLDVSADLSPLEKEADEEAREALVPAADWNESAVRFVVAAATVAQLARNVGVADAVVAGRARFERRNYRLLSSLVGSGQIRPLFPEISWSSDAS